MNILNNTYSFTRTKLRMNAFMEFIKKKVDSKFENKKGTRKKTKLAITKRFSLDRLLYSHIFIIMPYQVIIGGRE